VVAVAASDHLSGSQFPSVPTEKVGRMKSGDWRGTVEDAYQRQLAAKASGLGDWPVQQQELNEDIRANGITSPIDISPGHRKLLNGHHRYYAARETGLSEMPYRDGREAGS
jgi:hypothetical protein